MERRSEGHKQADNEKNFNYDEKDYVTKEWVIEKLKKQRYACAVCNESLDMYFFSLLIEKQIIYLISKVTVKWFADGAILEADTTVKGVKRFQRIYSFP